MQVNNNIYINNVISQPTIAPNEIQKVRNLISNAKTEDAIIAFINLAQENDDRDLKNALTNLKAQFSSLKRNENLGLISFSEANIKRAQIVHGVLNLLEDFSGEKNDEKELPNQGQKEIVAEQLAVRIDPIAFQNELVKERANTLSEFETLATLAVDVVKFLKIETLFDEDDQFFSETYSTLDYAVRDLVSRKTPNNVNKVLTQLAEHQETILELLIAKAKENKITELYLDAKQCHISEFIEKYDLFIREYIEKFQPKNDVLQEWTKANQDFEQENIGKSQQFLQIKTGILKSAWMKKYFV